MKKSKIIHKRQVDTGKKRKIWDRGGKFLIANVPHASSDESDELDKQIKTINNQAVPEVQSDV